MLGAKARRVVTEEALPLGSQLASWSPGRGEGGGARCSPSTAGDACLVECSPHGGLRAAGQFGELPEGPSGPVLGRHELEELVTLFGCLASCVVGVAELGEYLQDGAARVGHRFSPNQPEMDPRLAGRSRGRRRRDWVGEGWAGRAAAEAKDPIYLGMELGQLSRVHAAEHARSRSVVPRGIHRVRDGRAALPDLFGGQHVRV